MAFLRSCSAAPVCSGPTLRVVESLMYNACLHNEQATRSTARNREGAVMRFRAIFMTAALTLAVTPAFAAKITVSQYGRLVATLPWAVAQETGMFKEAGLDIDGITAGAGGGTSLRNMLAGELPYAELATSA